MGCSSSIVGEADGGAGAVLAAELKELHASPPYVPIHVKSALKKASPSSQNIIFIFGGPGSMKGLMIEELVREFGFSVITTEEIVISYLPNKVANTVQTTQEIQELLRTDPGMLTLDWVCHLISAKLATSMGRNFLIDLVPNLLSIQRANSFSQADYKKELSSFEKRHVVLFALSFQVPLNQLGHTTPGIAMKRRAAGSSSSNKDENTASDSATNGKDKEEKKKSVFETGSDEADNSRMKRRNEVYLSVAQPFMNYFEETDRLVTVEVVSKKQSILWNRIDGFFRDLGFATQIKPHTVVLFVFDESEVEEELDLEYYGMKQLRVSTIVSEEDRTLESIIRRVRKHIFHSAGNYLVILDKVGSASQENHRAINFVEVQESYLEKFIKPHNPSPKGIAFRHTFKAISTPHGEICLFTTEVDNEVAKRVVCAFSDPEDSPAHNIQGESTTSSFASSEEEYKDLLNPQRSLSPAASNITLTSDLDRSYRKLTTVVTS